MVKKIHRAVVADQIILTGADRYRFVFPVARALDIRLIHDLAINDRMSIVESDGFAREPDDSFKVHEVLTGQLDGDDIAPPRRMKQVGLPVNEVHPVLPQSREHADPDDFDAQDYEVARKEEQRDPDAEAQRSDFRIAPDCHALQQAWGLSNFTFSSHNAQVYKTYASTIVSALAESQPGVRILAQWWSGGGLEYWSDGVME